MTNPKDFLKSRLTDIFNKVGSINIRYEYSEFDDTHIVEVTPVSEFDNNKLYYELERELLFNFNDKFLPSIVLFVSENSLNKVINPEFELLTSSIEEQFSSQVPSNEFKFSIDISPVSHNVKINYSSAA